MSLSWRVSVAVGQGVCNDDRLAGAHATVGVLRVHAPPAKILKAALFPRIQHQIRCSNLCC